MKDKLDICEKAKLFALHAHKNQVRKNEPDKPMIMHLIDVANIIKKYNYDDNIIAAGYLHDVIEDTKYKIDDIKKVFGEDIANLVLGASETDKTLSWEERKEEAIKKTKFLSLRNKIVICADKISNLEDLSIKFEKEGKRDFSRFKRGEEKQKWYYTSIYESIIYKENEETPIFKNYKDLLDKVFNDKEDLYLKNTIYNDNLDYYNKLKKLHAQKEELKKLNSICPLNKPYVIEFTGTPRTGKTTTINNLYDFFKKGGFSIKIIEEFTTSKNYKENFIPKYKEIGSVKFNLAIMKEVTKQLKDNIKLNNQIIIIDRSINDRQIWNHRKYLKNEMDYDLYQNTKEKYKLISKKLIDYLVITCAEPIVSLKRDYNSSLALEKRTFLNINNLNEYNKSLKDLKALFNESVDDVTLLDTSNINMNEVSIIIASNIMEAMRKKYIDCFKKTYKIVKCE